MYRILYNPKDLVADMDFAEIAKKYAEALVGIENKVSRNAPVVVIEPTREFNGKLINRHIRVYSDLFRHSSHKDRYLKYMRERFAAAILPVHPHLRNVSTSETPVWIDPSLYDNVMAYIMETCGLPAGAYLGAYGFGPFARDSIGRKFNVAYCGGTPEWRIAVQGAVATFDAAQDNEDIAPNYARLYGERWEVAVGKRVVGSLNPTLVGHALNVSYVSNSGVTTQEHNSNDYSSSSVYTCPSPIHNPHEFNVIITTPKGRSDKEIAAGIAFTCAVIDVDIDVKISNLSVPRTVCFRGATLADSSTAAGLYRDFYQISRDERSAALILTNTGWKYDSILGTYTYVGTLPAITDCEPNTTVNAIISVHATSGLAYDALHRIAANLSLHDNKCGIDVRDALSGQTCLTVPVIVSDVDSIMKYRTAVRSCSYLSLPYVVYDDVVISGDKYRVFGAYRAMTDALGVDSHVSLQPRLNSSGSWELHVEIRSASAPMLWIINLQRFVQGAPVSGASGQLTGDRVHTMPTLKATYGRKVEPLIIGGVQRGWTENDVTHNLGVHQVTLTSNIILLANEARSYVFGSDTFINGELIVRDCGVRSTFRVAQRASHYFDTPITVLTEVYVKDLHIATKSRVPATLRVTGGAASLGNVWIDYTDDISGQKDGRVIEQRLSGLGIDIHELLRSFVSNDLKIEAQPWRRREAVRVALRLAVPIHPTSYANLGVEVRGTNRVYTSDAVKLAYYATNKPDSAVADGDKAIVAFFKDEDDAVAGKLTVSRPAKWLQNAYPAMFELTSNQTTEHRGLRQAKIDEFVALVEAGWCTRNDGIDAGAPAPVIHITDDPRVISGVYAYGPKTCMSGHPVKNHPSKRENNGYSREVTETGLHPAHVYAPLPETPEGNRLALAYMTQNNKPATFKEGDVLEAPTIITGRALIRPSMKLSGRPYGDIGRLTSALKRQGYSISTNAVVGAHLRRVEIPNMKNFVMMPYVDSSVGGGGSVNLLDAKTHVVVAGHAATGANMFSGGSTNGMARTKIAKMVLATLLHMRYGTGGHIEEYDETFECGVTRNVFAVHNINGVSNRVIMQGNYWHISAVNHIACRNIRDDGYSVLINPYSYGLSRPALALAVQLPSDTSVKTFSGQNVFHPINTAEISTTGSRNMSLILALQMIGHMITEEESQNEYARTLVYVTDSSGAVRTDAIERFVLAMKTINSVGVPYPYNTYQHDKPHDKFTYARFNLVRDTSRYIVKAGDEVQVKDGAVHVKDVNGLVRHVMGISSCRTENPKYHVAVSMTNPVGAVINMSELGEKFIPAVDGMTVRLHYTGDTSAQRDDYGAGHGIDPRSALLRFTL